MKSRTATSKETITLLKESHKNSSNIEKALSSILHKPKIEALLDIIQFIFNPKVMTISGAITIILTIFFIICSVAVGYDLKGSEIIISFILGYALASLLRVLKFIALGGNNKL